MVRTHRMVCGLAGWLGVAGTAGAQQPPQVEHNVRVEVLQSGEPGTPGQAATWFGMGQGPADFDIIAAPIGLENGTVKGAPYAAEAVTEVTQTLSDGNRIVRKSSASIFRDSAGRTRREQGITAIGPLVNSPDDARQVSLNDPQQGASYILDPGTRVARKFTLPRFERGMKVSSDGGRDVLFTAPAPPPPGVKGEVVFQSARAQVIGAPKTESLGVQVMEGVSVEGTRTTTTIPAGQIGNERPIEIVSERWFSPELKVLVASRQADPRFGETTYRLTDVVLGEPPASMFEVPQDYKVIEGPPAFNAIRRIESREK